VKIGEALVGVSRLYIDASPLIYFVERNPAYVDRVRAIIEQVDAGSLEGVSSVMVLTEVLAHPIRLKESGIQRAYHRILRNSTNFRLIPLQESTAVEAANFRAHYNLRTPDALHIATALEAGCEAFLTNDHALRRVSEIRALVLDDLELPDVEKGTPA